MVEYVIRYTIDNDVYESKIRAVSSGSAIRWVETQFPSATAICIVV